MGQQFSQAVAYLITFRTYGTWLHGDRRGSVARRTSNTFATPQIGHQPDWEAVEAERLIHAPVHLSEDARMVVAGAIANVCNYRTWSLLEVYVGTEHVHVVVDGHDPPERIMNDFKSYATRALRKAGLHEAGARTWSRHGSTRYLWSDEEVARARWYVSDMQSGREAD